MNKVGSFFAMLLFFALTAVFTTPAQAGGFYLVGKIGGSFMEIDGIRDSGNVPARTLRKESETDDVSGGGIGWGFNWKDRGVPLRTEMELTFRSAVDYTAEPLFTTGPIENLNSDLNSHTLFVNFYLDLTRGAVVPYIGGGVGLSRNIWDTESDSFFLDDREITTRFAWNASAGVAFELHRHFYVDLNYRYIDFGKAEIDHLIVIEDITAHEAMLAWRIQF